MKMYHYTEVSTQDINIKFKDCPPAKTVERIQCGLMLYKFQSIARDKTLYLPYYAPDGKFMTMQELIESGKTPFDAYLMRCDTEKCEQCRYQSNCSYTACCQLFENIGKHYQDFTDGQDLKNFKS